MHFSSRICISLRWSSGLRHVAEGRAPKGRCCQHWCDVSAMWTSVFKPASAVSPAQLSLQVTMGPPARRAEYRLCEPTGMPPGWAEPCMVCVCMRFGLVLWSGASVESEQPQPQRPLSISGCCIFADLLSTIAAPPGERFWPSHGRRSIQSEPPDRFAIPFRWHTHYLAPASLI